MTDDINDTPDAEKARQLPEPSGYKILCALPEVEDKYESGILKADATVKVEEHSTVVMFVIKLGPQAYADMDKFPSGPWCKQGDWICIGRYTGSRFKIDGGEVRIINDDEVIATLLEPDDIKHV